MLKRWAPIILAVFLGAAAPIQAEPVVSQPPAGKHELAQSENGKSDSKSEQYGTEYTSPSVRMLQSAIHTGGKTERGANQSQKKWFDGWSIGDKIALVVGVVALFQFFALFGTVLVMILNGRRELRAYVDIDTASYERNPHIENSPWDIRVWTHNLIQTMTPTMAAALR